MADLLIVEPDTEAADAMAALLRRQGHDVRLAATAEETYAAIDYREPEMVVTELALPDVDGLVFVSELGRRLRVPCIMVVSERDAKVDRVLALRLGADDIMRKPLDVEEFTARLDGILRRTAPRETPVLPAILTVDSLTINLRGGLVTMNDQQLALTLTEFRLLTILANHPDEIVEYDTFSVAIWGCTGVSMRHLAYVHVDRLRRKLVPGVSPKLVTIRGRGYRLQTTATPGQGDF